MNGKMIRASDAIYIAAVDSAEVDKQYADYVCSGAADQDVIQEAVDQIAACEPGKAVGRRIALLPGNYYISDFPRRNQNGRVAVMMRSATNCFSHIGILVAGSEHTESTVIHITPECYANVADDESCSLFGCETSSWERCNWNHHVFKDLYVTVPDDQKNIVCFDGRFMGAMGCRRCKCICETKGDYGRAKAKLPVEGFVAFMGTYGSNNMWEEKWEFCQAEGFGQGFAIGSEHLIAQKCAAVFGRYGFTFNNYESAFGAIVHPMTLINCTDEANGFLWKFGKNDFKQCIHAYNISFEVVPDWFKLGGRYASEERPGDYVGHIDYVGNYGFYTLNDPALPFWEKGSGVNFETVNNMHRKMCTSEERRGYAANLGQEVFDTDLRKKLIYTGADGWTDLSGVRVE